MMGFSSWCSHERAVLASPGAGRTRADACSHSHYELLTEERFGVAWQEHIRELLLGDALIAERRCPYCATALEPRAQGCGRCGEDLSSLLDRPPLHEAYYRQAVESYEQGDLSQALDSLGLCLRLRPGHVPALRLAAGVSALDGRLDSAALQVARLLALSPPDPAGTRLAAALAAAGEAGQRTPGLARAVSDMSAPDTRLVANAAPVGARGIVCLPALAGAMAGAAVSALVQWAVTQASMHKRGRGRPSS
jgi:hypothetical protein